VDHKKGPSYEGQYFNFYVADVNSVLGTPLPDSSTYMIEQFRNGQRIREKQEVLLWNTPHGGSIGDGVGRYRPYSAAAPEQWNTGDYFCFDIGIYCYAVRLVQCISKLYLFNTIF